MTSIDETSVGVPSSAVPTRSMRPRDGRIA
jgi:hypothetical protein